MQTNYIEITFNKIKNIIIQQEHSSPGQPLQPNVFGSGSALDQVVPPTILSSLSNSAKSGLPP